MKKMVATLLLLCAGTVFAQDGPLSGLRSELKPGHFWLNAGAEAAQYGMNGAAFGGSLSFGYSAIWLAANAKAAWFSGADGESVLELSLLLRFWLGNDPVSGAFAWFQSGPVLYAPDAAGVFSPDGKLVFTVGLGGGYRFLLGERFFLEPSLRAGYPYLLGAALSTGLRF